MIGQKEHKGRWATCLGALRLAFASIAMLPAMSWAADPQIASFTDTDPVAAGALYNYVARVDNNAADAATNVRLTLTVPTGAAFVSASPAGANCAPLSATAVQCNLGTVGGSGLDVRNVTFTWRAAGPGPTTINSSVALASDNDTNAGNNSGTQNTTVISGANLALIKTANPDPVVGGANLTYTLTASNSGPNASADIVITDNLPPSVSFVSAAGSGWTCSHTAGVVTCTRPGPHAVGAGIPAVTLVGTVNASGGTVTNSATVSPAVGGTVDPDNADNTATVNTTVLPGADVRIAQKTVSSSLPAVAGANVTFVIQPRNGGPAAATNVVVSDPLPAGWTLVSASGPNWTCSNVANTASCTRASMPVGATDNITVVATAPPNGSVSPSGQTFTNTANVSASSTDPNSGNNSGSVDVLVLRDGADLRLAKSKTPNPVALGANMTSTITVSNGGPRVATGPLRVVELLSGESFISASGAGWSCDASVVPRVICTHANAGGLAVGASLPTLSLITRADVAGSVTNTACTGSSVPSGLSAALASSPAEGDPNTGNDCSSVSSTSTTVQPDLAISKVTSTPLGGDRILAVNEAAVTYTLVASNVSVVEQPATGVVIRDTVPAFIDGRSSFASITATPSAGSTATFSCANVNAAVTCTQTGGQLLRNQFVTVVIIVNRPLQDGTFTNTATVGNTAEGDPNAANNSASDTIEIAPIADVEMTGKTVTPASVLAGELATYVMSFRNNGPSPALGVSLADTFTFPVGDNGVTVVAITSSAPGSSCTIAAGAVLAPGSASFSCTIGTLANGETQSVTLRLRPNFQAGNGARTFTNLARVSTTSVESASGGDNGNNEQSATLAVGAASLDLLVNKTDAVDPVPFTIGSTFLDYQVAVTNNGPSFGTGVRITENMVPPVGKRVRFICDTTTLAGSTCNTPALCSVSNVTSTPGTAIPTFTCSVPAGTSTTGTGIGELASGSSKNIFLRFEVLDQPAPTGDVFNNTATVSANEPDSQAANNSEGEQTTARQRVDLRTTKTATVASPTLMQPFNWVITVINNGPGNSLQTYLTDTLPAQAEVTGAINWTRTLQAGSGSCTLTGVTISCALGQLDAGGSATITVPVRITSFPSGGTLTNTATVDTDPNKTGGIDTPGGNNTGTSTLTIQRSSLTGTVFEDRSRAGANGGTPQAAGTEPRVSGVTVRITGTDAYGNVVNRTTTTNGNGDYTFNNLAPSNGAGYTLTQTQPSGFDNGPVDPPSAGGTAPSLGGTYAAGGTNGNSSYSAVAVGASDTGTRYNFPELRRPSLGGFVYIDVNANNARDAGTDLAIAGATVRLLNANTLAVIATAVTDGAGSYNFTNLDPLTPYVLEQPLPSTPVGLANGPVNAGLVGGAACAAGCTAQPNTPAAGTDRIAVIDLSSGADGTAFNFGEVQLSSVSGLVWVDNNRDATLNAGETTRLSGVTIRLVQGADCTSGTTLQTTTTASDGSYRFDKVRAFQNYLVCQTQPVGYGTGSAGGTLSSNAIAISNLAATGSSANNFGETLASLAVSVYADTGGGTALNFNNGSRDVGETGVANVPVTLTGTDVLGNPVNITLNTDASGNVLFDGLIAAGAGGYTLTEGAIPPASGNFLDGRDTAGTAAGSAAVNDVVSGINLAAGQQATGYLFGELPIASISGTAYIDRDRDNTLSPTPTDGRIAGVTVRLVQGADCSSGTTLQTTATDASGNYSFTNLAAGGTYLICQTQPSGYANGTQNPGTAASSSGANVITVANLPATGSTGNHFGERVGSLSGSVFSDFSPAAPASTNNGQRDAGETGIANVPVTLTGRDINGAVVNLSTSTDASGNYSFADLLQSDASGYTVTEGAIPLASGVFNDGQDRAGTAGGSAAVNDTISAVVLGAGVQGSGYTFGELPIAPITGTVYIDRDRNNLLGATPTDGRIAGVTITLVLGNSCAGSVVASTVTDAAGNYSFSGVSAGLTYTLCQTQPVGYADGGVNPGASGSSAAANAITISNLPSGGSAGNHFGERAGTLSGSVYLDNNNDGVRQPADSGISGVTVTLSGTDAAGNAVNRSAVTDASGNYRFDDVLAAGPGGYTVTEQAAQPVVGGVTTLNGRSAAGSTGGGATPAASATSAISGITLTAGADSTDNRFGELLPVAISGTVFVDINNNGLQNLPGDSGLPGVTLQVTGTDDLGAAVSRSVTTAADGSYAINDLRPGTYTVTEPTQPAGTSNGQTVAGSAGGTATGIATVPSAVSNIVLLSSAAVSVGNNFAEIPSSSVLEGRVWLDTNSNGLLDSTEAGIAGVTVELSGTDAAGRAVSRSTTTDSTGGYSFGQLSPGSYTVREPTQPAGTVNGSTVVGSRGGSATGAGTTPSAISGITLGVGETSNANNFGEVPAAQIAGAVYADNNNNGVKDTSEGGLGGVTLVLTGTDDLGNPVNLSTTTASDGSYSFTGLRPGTYVITQPSQPAGTVNGQTTPGSAGGGATPPSVPISTINAIVLTPGASSLGNNFGELSNSPDLRVSKSLLEPRLTVGFPGTYRITVRNVGELPSSGSYSVSDRLPTGLTLAATPTGTGWACVGAGGANTFTCTSSTVLPAGTVGANVITATVAVDAAAATGNALSNVVLVDGGGEIEARRPSPAERDAFNNNPAALPVCSATVDHNGCRTPTPVQLAASLSGSVWYDLGSSPRLLDSGDRGLAGWLVEVVDPATGAVVGRSATAADGSYRVPGLMPGLPLSVRFRDPASGVVFGYPVNGHTAPGSSGAGCVPGATLGTTSSCVGTGANPVLTVVLAPGQDLPQQSLPVDPSGVVYDSGLRQPVPGSLVSIEPVGVCTGWNPATGLVGANLGGYTLNGDRASMTVGSDGFYQFLFAPSAPASCTWRLAVTPPAGYTFQSTAIPPATGPLVPPGAAGSVFNVQPQAAPPTGSIGSATTYFLTLTTGSSGANVIHNHIPVDPFPPSAISLSKTGDKAAAEVGESVRYSITVTVSAGAPPRQTTVVDRLPAGFTYIRGTAMVGDVPIADPVSSSPGGLGPVLAFNLGPMPPSKQLVLRYRVRVGVGAQQGDGVNRAQAHACGAPAGCVDAQLKPLPGSVATNESAFKVRVNAGVFTTDACVLGKVFVDCNNNHLQDAEELGIPGVRLVMQDGTTLVSDSEGKYSVCGLVPKSAVLKVDPLTLPRGSRLTTSSNRNLGDAGSLWLDLKNGELHRADFIEGSCSNTVLEQVKARRAQGEVRAPETEKKGGPALRFDSKAHGKSTLSSPQQGTDGANQQAPKARAPVKPPAGAAKDDTNIPATELPMNRPPPKGRDSGTAADAGGANGPR